VETFLDQRSANIFLLAGEKAMTSTAFKEAFTYFEIGRKLLAQSVGKLNMICLEKCMML